MRRARYEPEHRAQQVGTDVTSDSSARAHGKPWAVAVPVYGSSIPRQGVAFDGNPLIRTGEGEG